MTYGPSQWQHIELSVVINVYLDQHNHESLTNLLKTYETYSSVTRQPILFVIVDDCSPVPIKPVELNLNILWFRVTNNIVWNQGGARNLGVVQAKSDKVIVIDLDLVIPEKTMQKVLGMPNPGKHMFKFWRRHPHNQALQRPHSNVFLLSRARFIKFFGYDEEFSGGYGAEDFRFVKYQKAQGTVFRKLSKNFYLMNRSDINREKSYHSLSRDFDRNTPLDQCKSVENKDYGFLYGHSRLFLNFQFTQTAVTHTKEDASPPRRNRWWKRRWLLRQLASILFKSN